MKNLTDFSKTVENGMDPRLQRRSFLSLSKLGRGPQDFDSKGSLPTFCQISEIKAPFTRLEIFGTARMKKVRVPKK